MADVVVTFNQRAYRLSCAPGEEGRLAELARYVKARLDGLAAEHGNVGDDRLLLMLAIALADELSDTVGARDAALMRADVAEKALTRAPKRIAPEKAAPDKPVVDKGPTDKATPAKPGPGAAAGG